MNIVSRTLIVFITIALSCSFLISETKAAEPELLNEVAIKAYLQKKAVGDPGSCLVDDTKIEIIGISDPVPGHQIEVFYKFVATLNCNRGTKTEEGQGVLRAALLRDGNWIDRETWAIITK